MKREDLIGRIADTSQVWDMAVVGGGATGLGIALDAALRGFSVVLFEQSDFSKGTSSRSTKLVHGGVRYLEKGDVGLVMEALRERGLLLRNAPHLVKDQSFVIPNYRLWDNVLYTAGLTFYDLLAGRLGFGRSRYLSRRRTLEMLPAIRAEGLRGGVLYHDGQFDDSRLAVNLMQSCIAEGAVPVNYMKVTGLIHDVRGRAAGVQVTDLETGASYSVRSTVVVNAAGVFVDDVVRMDDPGADPLVRPSQGVHLVLDRSFLESESALMIPKTSDGRVLFAVPWHGKVVVGTTDVLRERPELEPRPLEQEIAFILKTAGLYMARKPDRSDVRSVFAGQRPLAAPKRAGQSTKEISRRHKIIVSENRLITVTGGKWTTYRRMAQDTVDRVIGLGLLPRRPCTTASYHIHGYRPSPDPGNHLCIYGSDMPAVQELMLSAPEMAVPLSPDYPYTAAEAVWAVRHEMARTVEDILARRLRLLFLDARAAVEAAPAVAHIVAGELGYGRQWEERQVKAFAGLASGYELA